MPIYICFVVLFVKGMAELLAFVICLPLFGKTAEQFRTIGIGLEVDNLRYHPTFSTVFAQIALALATLTRFRIDELSVNLSPGQPKRLRKKSIN